jgi:hypothetical protein
MHGAVYKGLFKIRATFASVVHSVLCNPIYNGFKTVITTLTVVCAAKVCLMFLVVSVLDCSATVSNRYHALLCEYNVCI